MIERTKSRNTTTATGVTTVNRKSGNRSRHRWLPHSSGGIKELSND